jgi:dsDNA-specific endonuclease/ATPase MutS2
VGTIKFLEAEQREQVGFSFILEKLDLLTPYGIEEKAHIKPYGRANKSELIAEFENIDKLLLSLKENKIVFREIERCFYKLKDIRASIKRCENLITLDDVELFEIKSFGMLMGDFLETFGKLNLKIDCLKFHSLDGLVTLLDPEEKRIPTFYIYDKYSKRLKDIRLEKRSLEEKIVIENDDERLKELKALRLKKVIEEEEEELSIRSYITEELSKYVLEIKENIKSVAKLDLLLAKAKLALIYGGIKPIISEKMELNFKNLFNPEIKEILGQRGKEFTPISIDLKDGTTIITGANMGGKSVALKSIVLNVMLAQCGFFVFTEEAMVPVVDFIYFISDDMQSISKGLSTFGAEIIKLKEVILSAKSQRGFIALDEFARGTNPKEGYYLVKSLAKYLSGFNSISLISTHYDGVVEEEMVHYQVAGLKNVDFNSLKYKIDLNRKYSVEIIQEHMDYKLERVSKENKVPKDALNICMLLGLEEELVELAKSYYEEDK